MWFFNSMVAVFRPSSIVEVDTLCVYADVTIQGV